MDYLLGKEEVDQGVSVPVKGEPPGEVKSPGGLSEIPVNPEPLVIRPYCLHPKCMYKVDSQSFKGDELQLVLLAAVKLPNGSRQMAKFLVDTGAQVNLIRKGLIPEEFLEVAERPLRLRTVSGQQFEGGERQVLLDLGFQTTIEAEYTRQEDWFDANFFEADIKIDGILSFPWLVNKWLGVIPHLKALVLVGSPVTLFKGFSPQQARQWLLRTGERIRSWRGGNGPRVGSKRRRRWVQTHQVDVSLWDNEEEMKMLLGKMKLHLERREWDVRYDFLDEKELQTVARELKKVELARGVNRLIVTSEQEELPEGWDPQRIEGIREKIHQDFHGTALREEVFPNLPVRGRFG